MADHADTCVAASTRAGRVIDLVESFMVVGGGGVSVGRQGSGRTNWAR